MSRSLCVSVTEKTVSACAAVMEACEADMMEHRVDCMERIRHLDLIYSSTEKPIISTCRSIDQGGHFRGEESQRVAYLLEALDAGASYVDLELGTKSSLVREVRKRASETGSKLIVSKHFLHITPSFSDLAKTLSEIGESGADIAKIVTTPSGISDCAIVLRLYSCESDGKLPLVSFAMGDIGKFTRVCALFLGAPFMYVAQDTGVAAAPGQIPLSKMRAVLEGLL